MMHDPAQYTRPVQEGAREVIRAALRSGYSKSVKVRQWDHSTEGLTDIEVLEIVVLLLRGDLLHGSS